MTLRCVEGYKRNRTDVLASGRDRGKFVEERNRRVGNPMPCRRLE